MRRRCTVEKSHALCICSLPMKDVVCVCSV